MKLDVRILKCLSTMGDNGDKRGGGKRTRWAGADEVEGEGEIDGGLGVPAPAPAEAAGKRVEGEMQSAVVKSTKQEVIGRFIGGWGEKCFNEEMFLRGAHGRRQQRRREGDAVVATADEIDETDEEDDEDDDGRGLVSAGWGSGHDGSAIEILDVTFVPRDTARTEPGLGLRNRSQRLLEYHERRVAILGFPSSFTTPAAGASSIAARSASPSKTVSPSTKRKRMYYDHRPRYLRNPSILDDTFMRYQHEFEAVEAQEEEEVLRLVGKRQRHGRTRDDASDVGEYDAMHSRTVVLGSGAETDGDVAGGFTYNPTIFRSILFPTPNHRSVFRHGQQPSRKRRRTDEKRESNTMDVDIDTISDGALHLQSHSPTIVSPAAPSLALLRPLVLEGGKETYLLTPRSSSSELQYDLAIVDRSSSSFSPTPITARSPQNLLPIINDLAVSVPTPAAPAVAMKPEVKMAAPEIIINNEDDGLDSPLPGTSPLSSPPTISRSPSRSRSRAVSAGPVREEGEVAEEEVVEENVRAKSELRSNSPASRLSTEAPLVTADLEVAADATKDINTTTTTTTIRTIHRNLGLHNLRFTDKGVQVLSDADTGVILELLIGRWKWAC